MKNVIETTLGTMTMVSRVSIYLYTNCINGCDIILLKTNDLKDIINIINEESDELYLKIGESHKILYDKLTKSIINYLSGIKDDAVYETIVTSTIHRYVKEYIHRVSRALYVFPNDIL